MVNKNLLMVVTGLIVLLMIVSVFAITANIGNARMILRQKPGDTVSKTVLVNNINDISVDIESYASGDLENFTTIKNPKFTLAAGESKNIEFTIKVEKEGTTETKINVKFMPTGNVGGGVGLSSTVIIIAGQGNETTSTNNTTNSNNNNSNSIGMKTIGIGITAVVVIIFAVLLIIYLKKGSKNRVQLNRPRRL